MGPRIGGLTLHCKSEESWDGADRRERTKAEPCSTNTSKETMRGNGRFTIRDATERGSNWLEYKKGLEIPSQDTLPCKEAYLPGQVRAVSDSVGIICTYI